MKYDIDAPYTTLESSFEYHVLNHMLENGDISREHYENSIRELKAKYTKLAGLLNGVYE